MTARITFARRVSVAAAALALLAGCATTVGGSAAPVVGASVAPTTQISVPTTFSTASTPPTDISVPESSASDPSTSNPSTSSAQSSSDLDPAEFSARMQTASVGISSMIGELKIDTAGESATGAFSESVQNGKVTAIDMNLHVTVKSTTITLRLLLVDGKVYVANEQIMQQLGAPNKKWALASANSSNATLATLANSLGSYLQTSGTDQYYVYSKAASSIRAQGDERINNAPAHKYLLTVDLAKAAQAATGTTKDSMQQLLSSGVKTLLVTVWVDDQWRVVRAEDTVQAAGVTAKTHFGVSSYNSQVSITAPEPSTVFTG